ncbi:Phenylacetic acid catabolic protein [Natrarchaeobaculum aegyptiacum]|uniref:Phenylacetic acid catabolic family protein n=1 Tax=Natrarchaeobaculum aegyptiacum TaxID=745377 RepID=A0A2Z2I0A1_9EURY|nr:Phenylacetic acid catabolic protein [Natrarchaeobaculum aegyptiacum]ARS89558.1 phenylacetic acid catabolic family protein [Natrarchaeobaculum aegyptiacum]
MSDWSAEAIDYVQAVTDTKLVLSQRYSQWSLAGDTLEDTIGGSSAAQDEIGHIRQLANELEDQGRDMEWIRGARDPEEFANAACLDAIDGDWAAFMATVGPADRAAWYLLDAIDQEDLEGLLTKIGEDEYFHLEYHDARLETLAEEKPEEIQAALEETLPQALAFIGPQSYDEETDPVYQAGFTNRPVAEIREAFAAHYRDLFADTPVSLENVDWDVAADDDEWDATRRRVDDGAIAEEDVSQISGERNELYAMN